MARLLIRGGRILDPSLDLDAPGDCLIEDGRIAAVGVGLPTEGAEVLDAEGAWIAPGLIDVHAHLREPGQEYKEDPEAEKLQKVIAERKAQREKYGR